MEGSNQEHELIREYLLGGLNEEQRQQVELRVMTVAEFKEAVLLIEDELIEEYVSGALSAAGRERFDEHFLRTPQQRRRVRIARALRQSAEGLNAASPAARAPREEEKRPAHWTRRFASLWWVRRPVIAVALVIVALLLTPAAWWAVKTWQRANLERELARLNQQQADSRGDGQPSSSVLRQMLLPERHLRSISGTVAEPPQVSITENVKLARYELRLLDSEYSSYEAVFKRGGSELFVVRDLKASDVGRDRVVVVSVPIELFRPGDYLIQLIGRDNAGQAAEIDIYPFHVSRR
jgi:hypothetical protein